MLLLFTFIEFAGITILDINSLPVKIWETSEQKDLVVLLLPTPLFLVDINEEGRYN